MPPIDTSSARTCPLVIVTLPHPAGAVEIEEPFLPAALHEAAERGGHSSRYEFARAIINIMKEVSGIPNGWASVKAIGSTAYPVPAKRPRNPVISKDKIKRAYGIAMPHWRDQLRTFLLELAVSRNWER